MRLSQKYRNNLLNKVCILKGNNVSVDATHILANTVKKTPERLMKHLARNILQTYKEETGQSLDNVPEAPDYKYQIIMNRKL